MQAQGQRSKILIVGSGFGGLGMAIRLKQQGIHDFKIIERAAEVGGTWRDNTYPGVACDVPSHLYSFSFIKNPNWSRVFPQGRNSALFNPMLRSGKYSATYRFSDSTGKS